MTQHEHDQADRTLAEQGWSEDRIAAARTEVEADEAQMMADFAGDLEWVAVGAANRWGGTDFHLADGQTVRVYAVDGEWDVGVEIRVLNRDRVLMRSASYTGPFDLGRIVAMVDAIAPQLR